MAKRFRTPTQRRRGKARKKRKERRGGGDREKGEQSGSVQLERNLKKSHQGSQAALKANVLEVLEAAA